MEKFRYKTTIATDAGQTLLELLVAMSAGVVVLAAITVIVITALYNIQFAKTKNLATQYAQEGLEVTRHLRNSDFSAFNALPQNNCLASASATLTPQGVGGCGPNIVDAYTNTFSREVIIRLSDVADGLKCGNPAKKKITANVSWTDGKCTVAYCHTVSLTTCLTDFMIIPTPLF